jgi:hypothetical protein
MKSLILDLRWGQAGSDLIGRSVRVVPAKGTLVTYKRPRQWSRGQRACACPGRAPVVRPHSVILLVSQIRPATPDCHRAPILAAGHCRRGENIRQRQCSDHRPAPQAGRRGLARQRPFTTPAEVTINKEGIKPDIEVPRPQISANCSNNARVDEQ